MFTSEVSNAYIECKTAGYYLVFADSTSEGPPPPSLRQHPKALASLQHHLHRRRVVERNAASSASPRVNVSAS
jgi:hypothetical protein